MDMDGWRSSGSQREGRGTTTEGSGKRGNAMVVAAREEWDDK